MPPVIAAVIAYAIPATAATAFTIAGMAVTYATLIGYAVVIGAAIAYSAAQNAKLRNALKGLGQDRGRDVMVRDPLAVRRSIYGEVPVSGPIVFMATTGAKNETLHLVIALSGRECDSLNDVMVQGTDGDEVVPLDGTGINGGGNATGKYAGYFYCDKYLGTASQTANASLIAATGLWTTNHKLSGIAYLYCRLTYSNDIWPNGLPTIKCMVKGNKVFDPRDGTQNANTPSTWKWSRNAALCVADYLNDPIFGRGIPWSRINQTSLVTDANTSDESITLADSTTEPRYCIDGTCTADTDCTQDLLTACQGRITETGGIYAVNVAVWRTPITPTFTDDDLLGPFIVNPRQSMRTTFSGVKGTYISPINQWQPADFVPVKNDTYMSQDGGRRRWKDITLPYTISPSMAQRLAKIDLERGRQQIVIQATYKLKAFQIACCDVIQITRGSLGWTDKTFEILTWSLQIVNDNKAGIALAVQITAQETASGVYDWVGGSETTVDLSPNTNLPDPFAVPTPSGLTLLADSSTNFFQTDGTYIPRLKVTWSDPGNIYVNRTIIEYKKHSDSTWLTWNSVRSDVLIEYITDVQMNVAYDVRVIFQNQLGARSNNNGAATAPQYATVSNYLINGDGSAPSAPSGLAIATGTGKLIKLAWTANTEPDLFGYRVYRNTVNNLATATLIAFLTATVYNDATIPLNTAQYYWVSAVDDSGNESSKSGPVSATPTGQATGAAVTAPTAPSNTGSGFYQSNNSDGTIFSFLEFQLFALPSDGTVAAQELVYRRSGDSQWVSVGNYNGAATGIRIPDLTPGWSYEVGARTYNSFGDLSTVVTASGSPFTAPVKNTAPNNPTGVAAHTPDSTYPIPPKFYNGTQLYGCTVTFSPSTSLDIDHYEYSAVSTSTGTPTSALGSIPRNPFYFYYYTLTLLPQYLCFRTYDRTGNVSAWVNTGINLNAYVGISAGTMSQQNSNAVSVSGGNVTGVAIAPTSASGPNTVKSLQPSTIVKVSVGGSPSETFNWDISGYGFTAKPKSIVGAPTATNDNNVMWRYDYDDAAQSATNAKIEMFRRDGTNFPASTPYRFSLWPCDHT